MNYHSQQLSYAQGSFSVIRNPQKERFRVRYAQLSLLYALLCSVQSSRLLPLHLTVDFYAT